MNEKRKIGEIIAITVIITAILTFITTASIFAFVIKGIPFVKTDISKISQTYNILNEKYYKDIDKNKLIDAAVEGMINSLEDPYTNYMSKEEWAQFNTMVSGKYSGVGLTVSPNKDDNKIIVVSAFDDSPAAKVGIITGDKIIKVNGEEVFSDKLDDATSKMKGEKGTAVTLTVLKKDTGETVDIEIIRDNITLSTVTSEMKGNIGYVRISMFDADTGSEFQEQINKIISLGAKAVILDLRRNGGGVAASAVQVADTLLPKDSLVFYTQNKKGTRQDFKTTNGGIEIPIAVLVDEGTASASEIVSGAIKDNARGVLVGKKTFGKGLVQQVAPLSDGSVVKVTIEQYFTPSGADINKLGIMPDYDVKLESEKDEQLELAISLLKQKTE